MISVVNMMPQALSGEANQDSEPSIGVNPENTNLIAAGAFTGDPMGGPHAPIYVSSDGGATWSLLSIVPGGGPLGTGDITLRFAGQNGTLYASILRGDTRLRLNILRSDNPLSPTPMTVLVARDSVDQPFVEATTILAGPGAGDDRVFVGCNDFGTPLPNGQTATIDRSLDATPAPPPAGFASFQIEARPTVGQDGPQIRTAAHQDGTVYSVFYHWTNFSQVNNRVTSDVVVVRDDNWGTGPNPFTNLLDVGDGLAGQRVASDITFTWDERLGQQRLGGNASIVVDRRDSSTVYLAWADVRPETGSTLHVTRSTDRGATWSPDLRTVGNATNCALAVTNNGQVGFLYQQVVGAGAAARWQTHFERTDDLFATIDNQILADTPANVPVRTFSPYLGDYVGLQAVGSEFFGVFSANNTPDLANFPNGVTFLRNANFAAVQLLDVDNQTPVAISIDPFFFRAN